MFSLNMPNNTILLLICYVNDVVKLLGFYGSNRLLLLYLLYYNQIYNIIYKSRKLTIIIFKDKHIFYQTKLKFR